MTYINTDNVGEDGTVFLEDVESLTSGIVNGKTLVFAAGNHDGGLSVFELNSDGTLTNLYNLEDTGALGIDDLNEIQFAEVGGQAMLITAGDENAVNVFTVANDGTLTFADDAEDDSSTLLTDIDAMTVIEVGGTTFVVTGNKDSDAEDEGVSVFELDSSGNLTLVDQESDDDSGSTYLDDVRAMVGAESGGNSFVITGSYEDDAVSVFQVDSSGNLTNVFNLADGTSPDISGEDMELNGIRAMATIEAGGNTYVYVSGAKDDGISVFELNSDGSLTNTQNIEDGGVHNLDNVRSLETVEGPGGIKYLVAVGDGIDGIQGYVVNSDGSLSYAGFVADDASTYLDDAEDITFAVVDGKLHAIAGGDEEGISVFTVPCFASGTPIVTMQGLKPVETIRPGDWITTADNGAKQVRFVAIRHLKPADFEAAPHLAPVIIRANSFGPGKPLNDISVSPQHRILVTGYETALNFGVDEALAPAKALIGGTSVVQGPTGGGITYVHLGFDGHEVIYADGLATESFMPGPEAVRGLDASLRAELLELFPALSTGDLAEFTPARMLLRPIEARLLAPEPLAIWIASVYSTNFQPATAALVLTLNPGGYPNYQTLLNRFVVIEKTLRAK